MRNACLIANQVQRVDDVRKGPEDPLDIRMPWSSLGEGWMLLTHDLEQLGHARNGGVGQSGPCQEHTQVPVKSGVNTIYAAGPAFGLDQAFCVAERSLDNVRRHFERGRRYCLWAAVAIKVHGNQSGPHAPPLHRLGNQRGRWPGRRRARPARRGRRRRPAMPSGIGARSRR